MPHFDTSRQIVAKGGKLDSVYFKFDKTVNKSYISNLIYPIPIMLLVFRGVRNHKPYFNCDAHTDSAELSNMLYQHELPL